MAELAGNQTTIIQVCTGNRALDWHIVNISLCSTSISIALSELKHS